jgi:hypothetical protein
VSVVIEFEGWNVGSWQILLQNSSMNGRSPPTGQ